MHFSAASPKSSVHAAKIMSESRDSMTSSQPYLLRALNEWIVDNGATPQILIDSAHPDLTIPDSIRTSEKVVLNISPSAVRDLEIDNEYVSFVARFSGVSHGVLVPIEAIQAIYARESGQGMMFPQSDSGTGDDKTAAEDDGDDSLNTEQSGASRKGKPNLKVIK